MIWHKWAIPFNIIPLPLLRMISIVPLIIALPQWKILYCPSGKVLFYKAPSGNTPPGWLIWKMKRPVWRMFVMDETGVENISRLKFISFMTAKFHVIYYLKECLGLFKDLIKKWWLIYFYWGKLKRKLTSKQG